MVHRLSAAQCSPVQPSAGVSCVVGTKTLPGAGLCWAGQVAPVAHCTAQLCHHQHMTHITQLGLVCSTEKAGKGTQAPGSRRVTVTRGVAGAVISSSPHPPPKYQRTSEMCFDKAAGSLVDTKSVHMLNVEPLLPPGVGWLSVGAQLWRSSAGDRQGPSILEISNLDIDIHDIPRRHLLAHSPC